MTGNEMLAHRIASNPSAIYSSSEERNTAVTDDDSTRPENITIPIELADGTVKNIEIGELQKPIIRNGHSEEERDRLFDAAHAAYLADCESKGVSPVEIDYNGTAWVWVDGTSVYLRAAHCGEDDGAVYVYRESA